LQDEGRVGAARKRAPPSETGSDAQALAGRTSDEATTFAVRLVPQPTAAQATRELSKAFPSLVAISEPSEAARAGANNQLISKAVLLVVVLALIIGALGVANTMLAAVLERRRELALLSTRVERAPARRSRAGRSGHRQCDGHRGGVAARPGCKQASARRARPGGVYLPGRDALGLDRAILIGVLGAVYPIRRVTRTQSLAALAET